MLWSPLLLSQMLPGLQIHMKEDAMPQTVLSIATVKLSREMLRREDYYEGVPVCAMSTLYWQHRKAGLLCLALSQRWHHLCSPRLEAFMHGEPELDLYRGYTSWMLRVHQAYVPLTSCMCRLTLEWDHADLKLYTRKVEVTRDKIPNWPHDKLTVLAEQSSVFYDLMTLEILEQVRILFLGCSLRCHVLTEAKGRTEMHKGLCTGCDTEVSNCRSRV